jgi:hypothetical protein
MKISLYVKLLGAASMLMLVLTACKPAEPTPTPVDVDAIFTSAAMTVVAEQTATALAMPTATFTASPTNTLLPPPTVPVIGTTAAAPLAPLSSCDNSAYIKDVTIPDGTAVNPGQAFKKTWLVSNTGTCTWTPTYKLGFGYGEAMGGAATPIGVTVAPGAQAEVSVTLTAPAKSGSLTGNWRLFNDKGEAFGTWLSVVVQVAGPTSAGAATATKDVPPTETPVTPETE